MKLQGRFLLSILAKIDQKATNVIAQPPMIGFQTVAWKPEPLRIPPSSVNEGL